jgi:hypothetical protein
MGQIRAKNLGLKDQIGRAINDFNTWPEWAKNIPFENSDRVMEGRLSRETQPQTRSADKNDRA